MYFSFFSIQNIKSNCYVIFLGFSFNHPFSDGKSIPSQLYLFIKGLIFVILCGSLFFLFLIDITQLLQLIENICYLFIDGIYWYFFCFLSNYGNLYMIHHDSDLFYDVCNTITEHSQTQTHYLSSILNYFLSIFKWIKRFFYNFFCFIINHDFYVITF